MIVRLPITISAVRGMPGVMPETLLTPPTPTRPPATPARRKPPPPSAFSALLRRRRDVLRHRDQPVAAFAHPIVEVALLLLAGRRKLLKDLLFLVSLLGQLVAHGEAVHLGRQQAQAGAGRELVELLAHGLDLADHLEALLQALLAGLVGRERRLEAGDVR